MTVLAYIDGDGRHWAPEDVTVVRSDEPVADPVLIVQRRGCHFQPKACALCGLPKANRAHSPKKTATCEGKWPRGCARCGENKSSTVHFGAPSSFNVWSGTGAAGTQAYKGVKDTWERIFGVHLRASGLPLGQERIYVEGEVTFPDAGDRDQGNFRVILEKALGDALERGGWLEKDDWTRYEFGALTMRVEPGVSETRLMLTPTRRRVVTGLADQGQLLTDDNASAGAGGLSTVGTVDEPALAEDYGDPDIERGYGPPQHHKENA